MSKLTEGRGIIIKPIGPKGYGFIGSGRNKTFYAHISDFVRENQQIEEKSILKGDPVQFKFNPAEVPEPGVSPRAFHIRMVK